MRGIVRKSTTFIKLAAMLTGLTSFSINAADDVGLMLIEAVRNNDQATVQSLIDKGTDVNLPQEDGSTALSWAVYNDDLYTTSLLIESGANPNLENEYGITPLWLACNNRNSNIADVLLNAGADSKSAVWTGETVLMTCARTGNLKTVTRLIENGADVNANEYRRGQTALMWAISEGYPQIAKVLISAGADVTAQSHSLRGLSPKVYLTHDGTVQVSSQGGFTPLLFSAQQGDLQTAKLLLQAGADINHATEEDGTALLLASANGHEDLAIFLLENGADPNISAEDGSGITPLHYALRDGLRALLEGKDAGLFSQVVQDEQKSLTRKYDKSNPLPGNSMPRLTAALLERGADPNAELRRLPARFRKGGNAYISINGVTPFLLASAASDLGAMQYLIEMGGESEVSTVVDEESNPVGVYNDQAQFQGSVTPLLAAAGIGRFRARRDAEAERALETVKFLVDAGAEINQANETGWTPLHAATYIGAESIIAYLVKEGANLNVQNGCGQTPLTLADATLGRGHVQIPRKRYKLISLLTDLGAGGDTQGPVGRCVEGRYGIDYFVERDNQVSE